MAEISCGGHDAALDGDWRPWCDDCHYALRARLAAVEAERDRALNQVRHWKEQEAKQRRLHHEQGDWKHRALAAELGSVTSLEFAEAAEARLAAVLALCERVAFPGYAHLHTFAEQVRAAATGEDDRGN